MLLWKCYIEDLVVDISLVEVVPKCLFKAEVRIEILHFALRTSSVNVVNRVSSIWG